MGNSVNTDCSTFGNKFNPNPDLGNPDPVSGTGSEISLNGREYQ
jgi:hypothetical protein